MISVVLPVRDAEPWLEGQLRALLDQQAEGEWELVIADNGSTDESAVVGRGWARHYDRVRWVDAASARRAAGARNTGVAAARGEILAFCDADDVVQAGWLASLAQALEQADVTAGIFDFRLLNGRPPAPPVPAAMQQFGFLPAGLSANLAVRREAFEAVGGFDDELPVGEDIDLCWRLQLAGYRFAVEPGAVVAKREPSGLGATFRQALAYGRCGPVLFRRHRRTGARRDLAGAARSWLWVLAHAPRLVTPGTARDEWARGVGMRIGRLAGSFDQRVFFP